MAGKQPVRPIGDGLRCGVGIGIGATAAGYAEGNRDGDDGPNGEGDDVDWDIAFGDDGEEQPAMCRAGGAEEEEAMEDDEAAAPERSGDPTSLQNMR